MNGENPRAGVLPAAPEPPVVYDANFLSGDRASELYRRLVQTIPWEHKQIVLYGKPRALPRLTCWFGAATYSYSGISNRPQRWTDELSELRRLIEEKTAASYNSCLANLYRDGNDSVGWHSDDEPGLGPTPTIASLSLGAPRIFKLKHIATATTFDYELLPGSLLVMYGPCQAEWRHAVPKRAHVEGPRINLTFRRFDDAASGTP